MKKAIFIILANSILCAQAGFHIGYNSTTDTYTAREDNVTIQVGCITVAGKEITLDLKTAKKIFSKLSVLHLENNKTIFNNELTKHIHKNKKENRFKNFYIEDFQ